MKYKSPVSNQEVDNHRGNEVEMELLADKHTRNIDDHMGLMPRQLEIELCRGGAATSRLVTWIIGKG